MAHFAQALTANVGHVVRELQAVHALSGLHALPEGKRIFTSLAYLVTRESHPTGRTIHVQQCGCGGGSHHERHPGALRFVVKGQTELVALVRELYKLAAAEKESGAVCFAARSRLFNQSAAIYRALGPEAFAEEQDDDAENAPPR